MALLIVGAPILLLTFCSLMDPGGSHPVVGKASLVSQCDVISVYLYSYSKNHGDKFPVGKSSTEVFQKLIDDQYVSPELFYVRMAGKVKPSLGAKLKPENVSFDFTAGVEPGSTDKVPLVFLTGFRVTYEPGAAAKAVGTVPEYFPVRPTTTLFGGEQKERGVAVYYMGAYPCWIAARDDLIPNFVPPDFNAHGKTYRQLTPDGVLR